MSTTVESRSSAAAPRSSSAPSLRLQIILAWAILIAQGIITFTGSIVRVTGSGLGCVSWPNCHPGSLVPVAGAAPWLHQLIEYGNRMLTFVVAAFAIAVLVAVIKAGRSKDVQWLAAIQIIGVAVQAVIGGISVLMELRWWFVAMHFLPSMVLVWLAAALVVRVTQPDDGVPVRVFPKSLGYLGVCAAVALAAVLATGTMVTGAGRHAGDAVAGQTGRLAFDLAEIANIHAHFMYLYLGLTFGLVVALYAVKAPAKCIKVGWILVALIVVQAAIGIIQYNFHIPRWTVPIHVLLSAVVTAATGFFYYLGTERKVSGQEN